MRPLAVWLVLSPVLGPARGSAQIPRFLRADSGMAPVDASSTPALRQRVSLHLEGVTVKEALTAITRQTGLPLAYSDDLLPRDPRVRLHAQQMTVGAALRKVLLGTGLDVVFNANGQATLVKQAAGSAQRPAAAKSQ